jgi:zinc/manganese transport system substrate-binding protein
MRWKLGARLAGAVGIAALMVSCGDAARQQAASGRRRIVATYPILAAVVRDLAGEAFEVRSAMPNGADVHEWEPSARDMEALTHADLIVENGLGLEAGMAKALDQARRAGAGRFTAAEHIQVRRVAAGEGIPSGDPDQAAGAPDPHLWTDPLAVKAVVDALAADLKQRFGTDLEARRADLDARLVALDQEIRTRVEALPAVRRKLVTGHESMGYFAQRYGFRLVGAVIPSMTSDAEGSAAGLDSLKQLIRQNQVTVVFTEVGTPPRTVEALAREARVRAVPLATHTLPADGSYFTFERQLASTILGGLQ